MIKPSLLGLAGALSAGAAAIGQTAELGPVPEAEVAAQSDAQTLALGRAIYRHDLAAWHATDAALGSLPNGFDRGRLKGYVVEPLDGKRMSVAFIASMGDDDAVVWEATVRGKKVRDARWLDTPRPLTTMEAAQRSAIQTAIPAVEKTCGRPMNTVVLGPEDTGRDEFFVYLLTPMRDLNEAVFGRHFRARVSLDGQTLIGSRPFTNSCAIFPAGPADAPRGSQPVGIVTSHLLDDKPQETHVFVSLTHGMDVYVMTKGDRLFRVNGKKMQQVER